jgi:hypothetical protein
MFALRIRVNGDYSSLEQQLDAAQNAGISIAKAKFLLRSFRPGTTRTLDLAGELGTNNKSGLRRGQVVDVIGRALSRLNDSEQVAQLDVAGIAHELAVDCLMVEAAAEHMFDMGLIDVFEDPNGVRLTERGFETFDTTFETVETAIEVVIASVANRLNAIDSGLGFELTDLLDTANNARPASRELEGYGNQVREYFKEITDAVYQAAGLGESPGRDETEEKVRAVAKLSGSQSKEDRAVALAKSLEKSALSFNEIVHEPTHRRPVATQLLMVYVVLVLSELLDAARL